MSQALLISEDAVAMEDVYRRHYDLLFYLASRRFRVPENDAENLTHEVFLAYISTAAEIRDTRRWLVGAVCNASRYYWRVRGRTEQLSPSIAEASDPRAAELADNLATRLTVRETLARLHEKCRETLRLRYFEGCSAAEVAKEFETTNRYAEKLIHKCLKRAHEIYCTLAGTKGR